MAGSDASLSLALSPLLPPLRFAARAGVSRLKDLEPLVSRVVGSAKAFASGESLERLSRIESAARGFDNAPEDARKNALAALVRALGSLVQVPEDIAALSGGPGKLVDVKPTALKPVAPAGPLETPVQSLRGVGPAIAEKLQQKGLHTVGDLLLNLPRRYEDRRTPRTVAEAPIGERSFIRGRIIKAQEARGRRKRLEVLVRDDAGGTLVCIWFHYRSSMLTRFPYLSNVMVSGEVREGYNSNGKVMHHPDVELLGSEGEVQAGGDGSAGDGRSANARSIGDDSFGRVIPVYSDIEGVPPRTFRRIQKRAVDEYSRFVKDVLPPKIVARRKLLPLDEALREAHFPDRFA
ncbi:MAG TPA: hypothetical protein VH083_26295, partial [Myxococcales bacterium]|nr:hypothetical protein [Myxococcales bacterium]